MNSDKILGNFVSGFCTGFLAASWAGGYNALMVALANAVMFGGLAAAKELNDDSCKKRPVLTKILTRAVLL